MDPNTQIIIIALVALVVIGGLAWFAMRQRRTHQLRDRYGDEYDRTVEAVGRRDQAEANLMEREQRVKALDIRPLTQDECETFGAERREVKALFVDSPSEAVLHADRLLATMMKTRGYPMADFDRRYEDLTVDHGDVANHYREGHLLATRQQRGEASTEDLRQAMVHYEMLFDDLVSERLEPARTTRKVEYAAH